MLKVTGKIHSKYKMITGTSSKGAYRLIEFVVYKQYNGDKIPLLFVAHGNMADKVEGMPMKKKIVIQFLPKCTEKNGKWYTDLKVLDIQDWAKKEPYNQVLFSEDQPDTRTIAEVNPAEISRSGQQLSLTGERDALDEAMERSSREANKETVPRSATADLPFPEDAQEVKVTLPSAPPLSREALLEKGKKADGKGKSKGKKNSPF